MGVQDLTVQMVVIVVIGVFFASFMDAIAGGGGIISVPTYLLAGLPMHFALGTNKFSSSIGTAFSTGRYIKNGYVDWKLGIPSIVLALIGSFFGTKLQLMISEVYLQYLLISDDLGLSLSVNPELICATEMARTLRIPSAIKTDTFFGGKVELLKFQLPADSPLAGRTLMELPGITRAKVLICAVERGEQEIHIPSGSFRLQAGDRISFVASYAGAQQFFRQMKLAAGRVRSAMLIGGGRIAYYLAKQLVEVGLDVKIIESDPARCEELSVLLPKAEILRGDGTNEAFLRKCGIETTGAVAALTGIDEENVLIGMYIRKTWPKVKVITKVNRTSFQSIIDSMDLGSVFNPRNSASNLICRYVRAMQNSGSSSQIETLYKLVGGKAEALEFRVSEGSKLCGIPLQELKLRENLLIGCIGRGGQIIIPSGQDAIEPGDSVIVVTCSAGLGRLEDILARGPGHE